MLEIAGFEHIHVHTDYSLLDGYSKHIEYCERASKINQKYICITDHGMMGGVPRQIAGCEKHGLHPIFGCELYLNPMQPAVRNKDELYEFTSNLDENEKKYFRKSFHLLAIAYNEVGYANLVNLTSWAWINGQGGRPKRPRVNYEQLLKHKEGIIFSSACYNGEIGQAFDGFFSEGGDEAGFAMVEKYQQMFPDNFYLEMMLLDFSKQVPYDAFLIRAHDRYGIPLVVSNDCHYCHKEDALMQRLMLMLQTNTTMAEIEDKIRANPDVDLFELQDTNLWMKSEEELNQMWLEKYSHVIPDDLFRQAKQNTVAICEQAKGVQLDRSIKLPQLLDADERFKEAIIEGVKARGLPMQSKYLNRIKEEYELICRKGFSSYFLIQKQMTDEARIAFPRLLGWGDGSEAVGPGRGSGCGSLILYCLGITDVDPIKHDLLFSRFLSESRGGRSMKLRFNNIDPVSVDDL